MHVLLRGGWLQRLRLASGLVLFTFAGTHFLNHGLGLVSLAAMHQAQDVRTMVTRSLPGTVVLAAALMTHITLGLYKLAQRKTLKMPLWEALQILVALAIPFLLFPHIVNTRIAHVFFGVNDFYQYELARLWPDRAFLQSLLLVLVWAHGCIGLHYSMRLTEGYERIRPTLWAIAAFVPVWGIAGFAVSGQLTADIMSDPESLAQLKQRSNWPGAVDGSTMAWLRDLTQYGFGLLLTGVIGFHLIRARRSRVGSGITVAYRDGPTVEASPGMTLLETSRAFGVPHASVCGGRARCFTCRVKIDEGLDRLPAPNAAESIALRALEAPANLRLACQFRPRFPLAVTILNKPAVPGPVQVEFVEVKSVVAAHARAILGDEVAEIEATDPAAVADWIHKQFGYDIPVPDLSAADFLLRGARVDYLEGRPVPTLVFCRDTHPISLYVVPLQETEAFAVRGFRNGYSVVGWADADFAYWAAADIDREILDALQDACSGIAAPIGRRMVSAEQIP
jgi:adenylate cyclase